MRELADAERIKAFMRALSRAATQQVTELVDRGLVDPGSSGGAV